MDKAQTTEQAQITVTFKTPPGMSADWLAEKFDNIVSEGQIEFDGEFSYDIQGYVDDENSADSDQQESEDQQQAA